ncbi:MAG: YczE/YyaS/YitT family protein [Amnibacterium sp.]
MTARLAVYRDRPVRRGVQLATGLVLFGFSAALLLRSGLGLDPWNAFSQGLARTTGLTIGTVTVAVSFAVLLAWIPLRQLPGLGSVANALVIGPVLDASLRILPRVEWVGLQVVTVLVSIVLTAVATGLYVGAGWGPGPRDGLMTGLHRRFGLPIWTARLLLEATVATLGWLLGGVIGFATFAFAAAIGPLVGIALRRLSVPLPRT